MNDKNAFLKDFYENLCNEDERLTTNCNGKLEYFTTMSYIDKYLKPNCKILEVGAGTGRYSIALAKMGYNVNAIELIEANLKVLKQNAQGLNNITAEQGDAIDLSRFADNTFDIVLVLGPLYHLYTTADQEKAINEAIRVCKKDGIIMYAFIPDDSIIYNWGIKGHMKDMAERVFNKDYSLKQLPEEIFATFRIQKFEAFFDNTNTTKLHLVSTDGILEPCKNHPDFNMDDEAFEIFKQYHLTICERYELLGYGSHLLYICKKN